MIYSYCCQECGRSFEEFRSVEERFNVFCCGKRADKLISLPNTHKDLAYNFTTDMFDGKPVQVRSKEHYKGLMKQYGIADASPKECFDQARKCAKSNEDTRNVQYQRRAKVIAEKFKSNNVAKEGKEILTKLCKTRKEE